jgi:hypothetical protein
LYLLPSSEIIKIIVPLMIPLVFSNLLGSKFSENLFLKAVKPPGNSASVCDSILSTGGGGKIGSTDLD